MIYFDNAASTFPKPAEVNAAMYNWIKKNGANPGRSGHDMSLDASELIFQARCALNKMFGVGGAEKIAFVKKKHEDTCSKCRLYYGKLIRKSVSFGIPKWPCKQRTRGHTAERGWQGL